MYYVNASTHQSSQATYWSVYLGQPEVSLARKYPGEDSQKITINVNIYLLSSGYVEGNGYGEKGKIDCMPSMRIKTDSLESEIALDSVDCIFDYGQKVRLTNGKTGEFIIEIEGQRLSADRFLLSEYMNVDNGGEKELQKSGDDIPVAVLAFTKEGITWAAKAMAGQAGTDSAKADTAKATGK